MTLVYLVTNEYDGTDELGFAWNDEQAGVPWPVSSPTLSGSRLIQSTAARRDLEDAVSA